MANVTPVSCDSPAAEYLPLAVTAEACTHDIALATAEECILAALSRRPLGLYPAESVAIAADVELEETTRALERLVGLGLVECSEEPVPSRPVRRELVWKLAVDAWSRVPDLLRHTPVRDVVVGSMPERLPGRFRHLFWWGDTSLYHLPRDAVFVAEQILTSDDVTSWSWALLTLPTEALEQVAQRPHVPVDRRELIHDTLAWRRGVAR